ncbi:hypothetical protein HMPREF0058_0287 [Actinomyces urogenitalis DSM 15434]|uniref:Uncharacterized protein n=1 Tax=Actinomyces urogenitalis DSM 15434 TaxID=525246 RepID=C0W343_9ACTO|nr:hypothetical protein HMPREF0058_0287 [Actinomyces urogenitalis DSM 15434]
MARATSPRSGESTNRGDQPPSGRWSWRRLGSYTSQAAASATQYTLRVQVGAAERGGREVSGLEDARRDDDAGLWVDMVASLERVPPPGSRAEPGC